MCRRFSLYGANITAEDYQTEGVRFIRTSDIREDGTLGEGGVFVPAELVPDSILEEGDFLISRSGTVGRAYVYHRDHGLCAYAGYLVRYVLRNPEEGRWLFYITKSPSFMQWLGASAIEATIGNVNGEKYANLLLPVPPTHTQRALVEYLDRETARLDRLVAAKERSSDLLMEKRRAIISQAVTRGINPSAPMKDTGIEWLGTIPASWGTKRVKYLFRMVTEAAPEDNDYELLALYTDIGVRPRRELEARGNKATSTDNYWIVRPGDLVVNKLLAWMGAFGVSEYEGVTSPAYDILRPTTSVNSTYYHHLFRCGVCFTEFRRRSTGIMDMRLRLYFDQFGDMQVPAPPIDEQDAIVSYISAETAKLDAMSSATERTISLLKERRTALIDAAVTGQLKVD